MNFKYTVYTPQKTIAKGMIDVISESVAIETLERSGFSILSLKRSRQLDIERLFPSLFSVKKTDVILFSRQLAMLLERGVGFLVALGLSKEQIKDKVDVDTWKAIDGVRSVGNIGAHMEEDINVIVDVEPNEAQLLVELIEILLKDWYVAREQKRSHLESIVKLSAKKKSVQK